jgi:hypothetical protein
MPSTPITVIYHNIYGEMIPTPGKAMNVSISQIIEKQTLMHFL